MTSVTICVLGYDPGLVSPGLVLLWIKDSIITQYKLFDKSECNSIGGIKQIFDDYDPDFVSIESVFQKSTYNQIGWFQVICNERNIVLHYAKINSRFYGTKGGRHFSKKISLDYCKKIGIPTVNSDQSDAVLIAIQGYIENIEQQKASKSTLEKFCSKNCEIKVT